MLDSPLSFDECLQLLRDQSGIFWGKPVQRSWISRSDGIVLRSRHVMVNNSFQTLADVRLQPGGQGTQVHVTLRSSYFVAAFITFWLGFAIVFNIVVLAGRPAHAGDLLLTLPFPIFGFGLLAFGRLLTQSDRTALMEFVGQVTGGRLTE